ncbi:hypothetical protein I203_100741 [Kwoniella mangroviensis CBS 8507]|uniref:uncharacterized protein n=1 Tax=Kwoniella mangroviensis CBS 8507 TaxID=1296122 RepID=UPI00080D65A3|nr:uncharacterized protein I203_06726 [Kwoniella mangroviensis CBS 8507]OCF64142.1 hypothetical protein I203_06726 [Kwoniella mangroviensis CBS 8507]
MSSFTLTPAPTPTSTLIPFNHNGRLLTLIPGKPLLYYALNKSRSPGPFRPGPPGEGEGDPDPNAESHVTFRSSSGSSEDCHSQEQGGQEEEPDWLDPPDDFDPIGYIDEDGQGHGKIDFGWALDGIPTYNPDTGNDNNLSDDSLKLVHEVIQINQGLGMNNFGTGLLWVGLFNKLPPISHEHHKVGYPISVERSFTSRNAGGKNVTSSTEGTTGSGGTVEEAIADRR